MLRCLYRFIFTVVGKVLQEFALLAALLSLAQTGSLVGRILGATTALLAPLRAFGAGIYHNTPFPTVMGELKAGIDAALDAMTASIQQDPQPALVAFILTYAIYKLAAFLCRMARAACPHGRTGSPPAEKAEVVERPSISRQLYDDQEPRG